MTTTRGRVFAALLVVAAAAGGIALAPRLRGGAAGAHTSGWLARAGKPVELRLDFEPERGRAKTITPAGGTLTATAGDGTRFELRLPPGALLQSRRISMIPVRSVGGLPLSGGAVAAVHLKPDGLQLLKPALLRIRPTREVPVAEQVAFGYTGNGHDAYLHPMTLDPTRVELPIVHFSGYGFGQAPPGDRGREMLRQASDKANRLSAETSAIFEAARARAQGGDAAATSDAFEQVLPLFLQYYREVVRPLMLVAEKDWRMADCAKDEYLGWERRLQLLGFGADGSDAADSPRGEFERVREAARASMTAIMENLWKNRTDAILERCRTEHDVQGAVQEYLSLSRMVALLGYESLTSNFSDGIEELSRCLTFELEFRSVVELKTPSGGSYHHVVASFPFTIEPLGVAPVQGPIEYQAFRIDGDPAKDLSGGRTPDRTTFGGAVLDEGASGSLSPAGTRGDTLRVLRLEFPDDSTDFIQTTCAGTDERQKRLAYDTLNLTLSPGLPVEIVRFTAAYGGEASSLAKAAAGFAQALGADAEAGAVLDQGRIGRGTVMEETQWARQWTHFHAEQVAASVGTEPGQQTFKLPLKRVQPGVWRTDFKQEEPPRMGFSARESGYLIVRHEPQP